MVEYSYSKSNKIEGSVNFIAVTPAKNEERFLLDLAQDMISQTVKPLVWVIVDDESTDNTGSLIQMIEKDFFWIRGIRSKSKLDNKCIHQRITESVRKGFDYAIYFCKNNKIDYNFLAVVDGDVRLERSYFERVIDSFHSNLKLGVASGFVFEEGMSIKKHQSFNAKPRGCAVVYRKECYEMIGGYQGDINSLLKAKNRKWQISTLNEPKVIHRRKSWSRKNYFFSKGKYAYFNNWNPMSIILVGITFIKESPYNGLSFLIGYFRSFILSDKKIRDKEIIEHFSWRTSFNRQFRKEKNQSLTL